MVPVVSLFHFDTVFTGNITAAQSTSPHW